MNIKEQLKAKLNEAIDSDPVVGRLKKGEVGYKAEPIPTGSVHKGKYGSKDVSDVDSDEPETRANDAGKTGKSLADIMGMMPKRTNTRVKPKVYTMPAGTPKQQAEGVLAEDDDLANKTTEIANKASAYANSDKRENKNKWHTLAAAAHRTAKKFQAELGNNKQAEEHESKALEHLATRTNESLEEMAMGVAAAKSGKKVEWLHHPGIGHSVTVNKTPVHTGFLSHEEASKMYKHHLGEDVNEGIRLKATYEGPNKTAKVYHDSQWDDHIVKYYKNGVHQKEADSHHYDDKDDAHDTAKSFVKESIEEADTPAQKLPIIAGKERYAAQGNNKGVSAMKDAMKSTIKRGILNAFKVKLPQ